MILQTRYMVTLIKNNRCSKDSCRILPCPSKTVADVVPTGQSLPTRGASPKMGSSLLEALKGARMEERLVATDAADATDAKAKKEKGGSR